MVNPVYMESAKGILNIILHQIIAVLLIYSIWTPIFTFPAELAWHVVLCTLGLFPFMIEGLAVLGYDLIYAIELEDSTRKYIHGAMMSLGTLTLTAGAVLEMSRERAMTHFSTSHGILGLVCLIFILFAFLLGFFAHFAESLKGYANADTFRLVHNIFGVITVILGTACMCTGYFTDGFDSLYESKVAATVVACLILPWGLAWAFFRMYEQLKSLLGR